jgi:hypothetical protein
MRIYRCLNTVTSCYTFGDIVPYYLGKTVNMPKRDYRRQWKRGVGCMLLVLITGITIYRCGAGRSPAKPYYCRLPCSRSCKRQKSRLRNAQFLDLHISFHSISSHLFLRVFQGTQHPLPNTLSIHHGVSRRYEDAKPSAIHPRNRRAPGGQNE